MAGCLLKQLVKVGDRIKVSDWLTDWLWFGAQDVLYLVFGNLCNYVEMELCLSLILNLQSNLESMPQYIQWPALLLFWNVFFCWCCFAGFVPDVDAFCLGDYFASADIAVQYCSKIPVDDCVGLFRISGWPWMIGTMFENILLQI